MNRTVVPGEPSPRWQRLVSWLIDGVAVWCLLAALAVTVGATMPRLWPLLLYSGGAYNVLCNIYGQSLGKRWLRMCIRRSDGRAPGFSAGLRRSSDTVIVIVMGLFLPAYAMAALTLGVFCGYAFILSNSERQSLYDQIAGTYVIRLESGSRETMLV